MERGEYHHWFGATVVSGVRARDARAVLHVVLLPRRHRFVRSQVHRLLLRSQRFCSNRVDYNYFINKVDFFSCRRHTGTTDTSTSSPVAKFVN